MASNSATKPISRAKATCHLIPSKWRKLPPELLEKVLTKLPICDLARFMCVSKQWKALIQSEQFGRRCESVKSTVFCLKTHMEMTSIAVPSLKRRTWEKQTFEFTTEYEKVVELVAADHGLLCYRVVPKGDASKSKGIFLVVQNPLTRKFRRLLVPYYLESQREVNSSQSKLLVGLVMDKETGNYKVVVASFDKNLMRETFIYDSSLKLWTTSAAVAPVLKPLERFHTRDVRRSRCWAGELLWLVEEWCGPVSIVKSLIKYSMELNTWSVATKQFDHNVTLYVDLAVDNRPILVNFCNPPDNVLPAEFLKLVPNMGHFGFEDLGRLLGQAGYSTLHPSDFRPTQVVHGGGTWFVMSDHLTPSRRQMRAPPEIFAFRKSPPALTILPEIYHPASPEFHCTRGRLSLGTFEATFKAFV